MHHDQLLFECLCQSIEPLMFGEPGVNFTCRPDKGTLRLMVQKGQAVAAVHVDRIALENASTPTDLQGVAREALTRLRASWDQEHPEIEQRPSHLDDAHSAAWNRTRQQPDQSHANRGEHPDTQAVYAGPGRGTVPVIPSSKYDDGQVNAADLGHYHATGEPPASKGHERVDGNVDPQRSSSKYDDSDKDHGDPVRKAQATSSESEHPKGATSNPRGTEGGRDGQASTDTTTGTIKSSKPPSAYPKAK